MSATPPSLLERIRRPADQKAWTQFVHLYTPLLRQWARRLGARGPDADELIQEVFVILVQKLPTFSYDPHFRFRGWLWTLTLNKWREQQRRQRLPVEGGAEPLDELADPDPSVPPDEAEYRQFLVQRCLQLMQTEFQPTTWQAFWECVVDDHPAADVARHLGISENAVYVAKSRVLRRLRQELDGLLD